MSTLAHSTLEQMAARGVFRARALPDESWQITWFGRHVMRWVISEEQVQIAPVLPVLSARSPLYRDLRAWLSDQQSADRPGHRRLDPDRIGIELRNRSGQVRLTLQSRAGPMPDLTARAVQLINAL